MTRFTVTEVSQDGRQYFMANYPAERSWKAAKAAGRKQNRKQKKFSKREAAEAFLAEVKREWIRKGGVKLGIDPEAHYDFMRAAEVICAIPNGTLEKAALVYRMCHSAKEKRGGVYEAPLDRKVELSPRTYLGCVNEARKRGVSLGEAVEGILAGWFLEEAERQIKERIRTEEREYQELLERNERTKKMLAQIEKENQLRALTGAQSWSYEQGRNSILMKRNQYQCEWRRKRKEKRS